MAIDSAPKRKSIVGISLYPSGPGVTPDGTPGQAWRQQSGYGYSGILADNPSASAVPVFAHHYQTLRRA